MKTSFLIIVVGLIILSSVIFVAIWNSIPKECDDKCEHERRAIEAGISGRGTIDPFERHSEFDISKVTTMPPNTMEIFYYSNTDDTTDFFKTFLFCNATDKSNNLLIWPYPLEHAINAIFFIRV